MYDSISKATRTSARFLVALSFLIISSTLLNFELTKLPFLDQGGLDHQILKQLSIPIVIYFLISHFFNWLQDYGNYLKHLNSNTLNDLKCKLDEIDRMIKEMSKSECYQISQGLSNVIGNFKPQLYKLKYCLSFTSLPSRISEFYLIYIQSFLIPVILSAWAIILLFS